VTGQVAGLEHVVELVADDLVKVEDFFEAQVRSELPLIAQMGRYIREAGGKRIRPALLCCPAA